MNSALQTLAELSIYNFKNTKIQPNEVMFKYVDTQPAKIESDLTLNGDPNPTVRIHIFNEMRRSTIFPKENDFMPLCCNNSEVCQQGDLYFQNDGSVMSLDILSSNEEKASKVNEIILSKKENLYIGDQGLWGFVLSNCGNTSSVVNGTLRIIKPVPNIDNRLAYFQMFSNGYLFILIATFAVFFFSWCKRLPNPTMYHYIIVVVYLFYIIASIFEALTFSQYSNNMLYNTIFRICSSIFRAISEDIIFYLIEALQQNINSVSVVPFLICIIPLAIGCIQENQGISDFASKTNGFWNFGFDSVVSIEFITICFIVIGIFTIEVTQKVDKSNAYSDERKSLIAWLISTFVAYFVSNVLLFVWRYNKTLLETRNNEWVGYILKPIFLYLLLIYLSISVSKTNPERWESLGFTQPSNKRKPQPKKLTKSDPGYLPSYKYETDNKDIEL